MATGPRRALPRGVAAGVLAVLLVLVLAGGAFVLKPWNQGADAGTDGGDPLVGHTYYANPAAVCELFEPGELELALGHPYLQGIEAPIDTPSLTLMPGIVRCFYSSAHGAGFVATGVVYAYAEQVFDRTLKARAERDIPTVEVDGLGDRAVWSGGDLLVLVDDKLVGVALAIETPTERDQFVLTRRLAEKAIERLR